MRLVGSTEYAGSGGGGDVSYLKIARQKDQRIRGPCRLKPFRAFM